MRHEERSKDELQRSRARLREHVPTKNSANDDLKAQYVSTRAEIEREKACLRDLIKSNKHLEEEITQIVNIYVNMNDYA